MTVGADPAAALAYAHVPVQRPEKASGPAGLFRQALEFLRSDDASGATTRRPRLGISFQAEGDGGDVRLGRFRGDRLPSAWPDQLQRGGRGQFPWTGL